MRIVVDRDLCESNGVCVDVCAEVFRLDDQDRLIVLIEQPDERLCHAVLQAVRMCPRQALSVDE